MSLKTNIINEVKSTLFGGALFLIGAVWAWDNISDLGNYKWGDIQVPVYFMSGGIILAFMKDKAITWIYGNTIGRIFGTKKDELNP